MKPLVSLLLGTLLFACGGADPVAREAEHAGGEAAAPTEATSDPDFEQRAEAIQMLEAILAEADMSGDRLAETLLRLAEAYEAHGRTEDARVTYQRVIDEHPQYVGNERAREGLARMGEAQGAPEH